MKPNQKSARTLALSSRIIQLRLTYNLPDREIAEVTGYSKRHVRDMRRRAGLSEGGDAMRRVGKTRQHAICSTQALRLTSGSLMLAGTWGQFFRYEIF